MKKVLVLVAVGMLIASGPGCQSCQYCPWRNAPVSTATYDGMAASPPMYSAPGMAAPTSLPPAGGCGPGCGSCGGN
jgi:hypothetical protein